MKTSIQTAMFCLLLSAIALAQTNIAPANESDKYAADVVWMRYKVSEAKASVMLPKMPVILTGIGGDSCKEIDGNSYFAYADEAVYEFRYVRKGQKRPEAWCEEKVFFGQAALNYRIAEINRYAHFTESDGQIAGRDIKIYRAETANERLVRWLIPDLENDRWLELAISSRLDKKPDEKRFLESIEFTAKVGAEIKDGAPATLGDKGVTPDLVDVSQLAATPLVMKAKARPGYTEIARQKGIQGSVTLKVTFLANGGIGEVSVVKEDAAELTERAISAAKRIVFLPARVGFHPITVVKQIQYSFSIY